MYSPVKTSKEETRRQAKEQKRLQLQILLVNKFRNKYGVTSATEPQVDQIINNEVYKLLQESEMYESRLNQIDRQLEKIIAETRRNIKNGTHVDQGSEQKAPSIHSIAKSNLDLDTKSQASRRSLGSLKSSFSH